jgi:C_GCAxxG_C_C family probable redox protein
MESRVADCAARHNRGFNCAQAIACTYCDLFGVDEKTAFAATEGLGLGMGGMEGTCGALSGACVLAGLAGSCADLDAPTSKAQTYKVSREMVSRFSEMSGATRCRDLKGIDTGVVLCSCPQCIENAAKIVEDMLFSE